MEYNSKRGGIGGLSKAKDALRITLRVVDVKPLKGVLWRLLQFYVNYELKNCA